MSQSAIIILALSFLLIGIILLSVRDSKVKKVLSVAKDDIYKDDFGGIDMEKAKEVKIKDPKNFPDLEVWNGGFIGKGMSGFFPRKGAPKGAIASYNCFYILYFPVFPLGCFLVKGYADNFRAESYCELKMEKDELFCVLSKGWGILLLVIGTIIIIAGLSSR